MAPTELEAFRREAEAFLDNHATRSAPGTPEWGVGDDQLSSYAARTKEDEQERVRLARAWKTAEFDAGLGWITGPVVHGGGGLTAVHERTYLEIRNDYDVPSLGVYGISLGMVAPTFLSFGKPEVLAVVPSLYRGDLIGCQLFSEPGAGSDVAGLSTKAERDGDEWVITGQKVWTSVAHLSDWGLLLARTNPDAPKHKGITAFAVDMKLHGVDVRPLKMMTGGTEFNEVFFNEVRIPDTHRLGEVDAGWTVAISTLMNERALGASGGDIFGVNKGLERLRMLVALPGMGSGDPIIRQDIARAHSMAETIRYQAFAADARRSAGLPPGPGESLFKLASTETLRLIVDIAGRVLGPRALADSGEWGMYAWADMILTRPAMGLAGGSDEILRNILSERVLGLPKEPGLS